MRVFISLGNAKMAADVALALCDCLASMWWGTQKAAAAAEVGEGGRFATAALGVDPPVLVIFGYEPRRCSSATFHGRQRGGSRGSQQTLNPRCGRIFAAEHAPRGPFPRPRASFRPRGDRRASRPRLRRAPPRDSSSSS